MHFFGAMQCAAKTMIVGEICGVFCMVDVGQLYVGQIECVIVTLSGHCLLAISS